MSIPKPVLSAFRVFVYASLANVATFFLAVKNDGTFVNIKAHGAVLLFGEFLALGAALLSLGNNFMEENTDFKVLPNDRP